MITNWNDVMPALDNKDLVLIPFCLVGKCEDCIKQLTSRTEDEVNEQGVASMGLKSLCIPFEQHSELEDGVSCLNPECENGAQKWTLFGRSY